MNLRRSTDLSDQATQQAAAAGCHLPWGAHQSARWSSPHVRDLEKKRSDDLRHVPHKPGHPMENHASFCKYLSERYKQI